MRQIRMLADLAFMLGDWELALSHYKLVQVSQPPPFVLIGHATSFTPY